jgi:hypothetical protein
MVREPVTSHRLDNSGARIYSPDAVVPEFRDVEVPLGIERKSRGAIEPSLNRRTAVATETGARPSDGLYDLRFRVVTSHSAFTVDEVKVAQGIEQQARWDCRSKWKE